jgi:hypothetical protein
MLNFEGQLVLLLDLAVLAQLGDEHLARLHLGDLGVADPLDVVVAQVALEHALGVAHAAQTHVADVGLGRDEGQRHLVAQFAALQVLVEDEGEFIGRAKARGCGHGADDGRAGVFDEFLVVGPGLSAWSMVQMECVEPPGPAPGISSNASLGPVVMMR